MPPAIVFERDVAIPTRDGSLLRANVYRPLTTVSCPVVMTLGPYGKDRHWADRDPEHARALGGGPFLNWETPDPETWVPEGYAVLRVDGRGTGASPGFLAPLSAKQAEDYYDAIEWAARQPWSSGKIGLLGISYYAMSQWAVAARWPPSLTAMIPWEGASDLYRDMMRHGGILSGRFLDWWLPNTILNVRHGGDAVPARPGENYTPIGDLARAHPCSDPFYTDWLPDLSRIEVPFLSVGNWGNVGLHLRGNVEAFVQASSQEKWLRILTGDHIAPFYGPESVALQKRFFGSYLKGEDTGWLQEPRVAVVIRDGTVPPRWRKSQCWPLEGTRWTTLHLDAATLTLSPDAPSADASVSCSAASEHLSFSLPPGTARTEITGPLAARLWMSSTAADFDVFVRLRVILADGTEMLGVSPNGGTISLACGWLRASHRAIDPTKSEPYRPWHPHDASQHSAPGEILPLDIELWPTSFVLDPGARLIMEIGGAELEGAYFLHADPADRPLGFGDMLTLHSGPATPSTLLLPVIPDG